MVDVMVSEAQFKCGDRVKLKSGGPMMTVSNVADGKIECSWFFDGSIRHETFKADVLRVFVPKKRDVDESA